jgi:hypothetical protein
MKQAAKLFGVVAVAVSISFLVLPALADNAHGSGMGRVGSGGAGRNFHGGGFGGGFHSRFGGGFHGRYWGGWGGWYPWGFTYVYAPSPYYYYDGYYYDPPAAYYPPSVVYSSQPAVAYTSPPPAPVAESTQQRVVDSPLSPTAVDRDSTPPSPSPAPRPQSPPPIQRTDQGPSASVADVKALAKTGLSDEVILSHIRNSHAVYHLTTAEIIDLKESGVSEKIIDFMINTASP